MHQYFVPEISIACYYFPNYNPNDARNHKLKAHGWSEWLTCILKRMPLVLYAIPINFVWIYMTRPNS